MHGAGTDEPLVWYEGSGTSDRRWLVADERGSIVAVTDASGAATTINRYDEYGIPAAGNQGRFQYIGQAYIPELGLYYYKARMYSPTLGRFMQTDLTGYGNGLNWYNYVGGDPINKSDPSGTDAISDSILNDASSQLSNLDISDIVVTGIRNRFALDYALQLQLARLLAPPVPPINPGQNSPLKVTYPDHSCDNVPIAHDPGAQSRMLDALSRSTRSGLSNGVEEWGFWGADSFSGGYSFWDPFTDHIHDQVDLAGRQPSTIRAWVTGNYRPAYGFHVHPNSLSGSFIDQDDLDVARATDSTAIVIDRKGQVRCGK